MFNKKRSFFERLTGMVDDAPEEMPADHGEQEPPRHRDMHRGGAVPHHERRAEPMPVAPQAFPSEHGRDIYDNQAYPLSPSSRMPLQVEPEEEAEGQLAVDVYQTRAEIIVQTMVAGVRPDDLNINITHEQISISGRREGPHGIPPEDYYHSELYWGNFSRTIFLPQEIEPEEAEAIEKHGLLIIRLPKVDKAREHKLKIKQL